MTSSYSTVALYPSLLKQKVAILTGSEKKEESESKICKKNLKKNVQMRDQEGKQENIKDGRLEFEDT